MVLSDDFRNIASDLKTCFSGLTHSGVSSPLLFDVRIYIFQLGNYVLSLGGYCRIDLLLECGADFSNIMGSGNQLTPIWKQFRPHPLGHATNHPPRHLSDDQTMVDNSSPGPDRTIKKLTRLGQTIFKRHGWNHLSLFYSFWP